MSDATFSSFCDDSQEFLSLLRLISKFTSMDHVQNVEKLCQRLFSFLRDHIVQCSTEEWSQDFNVDLGFGSIIWTHSVLKRFIDFVEVNIPVKDMTKTNWLIGIGTTTHEFQNDQGQNIFLPCGLYHLPQTDLQLFSPQTYHQMHGGHSSLNGNSVEMHYKGNRVVISIRQEQE